MLKLTGFCLILLSVSVIFPSVASATFISPKHVVIGDKQRAAKITIFNRSDEAKVYSFSWQRRARANEKKGLSVLKEGETVPGYRPADDFIIFSPRRVILKPGERQRIRLLVRRSADMEEGEYHSHFLIKADPLEEKKVEVSVNKGLGGSLSIRTYASIPVFLRHGPTNISLEFSGGGLFKKKKRDYVRINVKNSSTRTIYVQPKLECTTASGEVTETTITTIRAYVEAQIINEEIPIPKILSVDECSKMSLAFYGPNDFEYRGKVIDRIDVFRE